MCVVASVTERPFLFLHRKIIRERKKKPWNAACGGGAGREEKRQQRSREKHPEQLVSPQGSEGGERVMLELSPPQEAK